MSRAAHSEQCRVAPAPTQIGFGPDDVRAVVVVVVVAEPVAARLRPAATKVATTVSLRTISPSGLSKSTKGEALPRLAPPELGYGDVSKETRDGEPNSGARTRPVNSRIEHLDLSASMSRDESESRVAAAQLRLTQLRLFTAGLIEPHEVGPGLLVLFEGFDAAGKGGAIQRLVAGLDPRHVRVVPIGVPTDIEKRHHFLWRFWPTIPGRGEMSVFDRSWYGRGLVERVEHLIDADEVARSLNEIVDFERSLTLEGTTVVKFWLHISAKEQLRRFRERESDPLKQWKLTADDWHNRDQRAAYLEALGDILDVTDQPHARWDLISGEDKHYARVAVLETLIDRWVHDLTRRGLKVPESRGEDYLA